MTVELDVMYEKQMMVCNRCGKLMRRIDFEQHMSTHHKSTGCCLIAASEYIPPVQNGGE